MTTIIDPARLAERVKARQDALACIELIDQCADALSPDACLAFWDTMHARIHDVMPGLTEEQQRISIGPMSDAEAREYGAQALTFGKFEGDLIRDRLAYFDYILGQKQEEALEMARYLANEKVAEQLRAELERDDWRLDS